MARDVQFRINNFGWKFILGAQHGNDPEAKPFLIPTEVPSDCAVEYKVDRTVRLGEWELAL